MRRRFLPLLIVALAATSLAACNDNNDDTHTSTSPETSGTTGAEADGEPASSASVPPDTTPRADSTSATGDTTTVGDNDDEAVAASRALFADITADQPGCTVAVARGGKVVWADAFGAAQLDPLLQMTTATVVDIGSTSKQFTATAIAVLVEREELSLATPLAEIVPGLPEWAATTTIDQLVHHTSGIPDYIALLLDEGFATTDVTTVDDAMRVLAAATDLEFSPGSKFEYSNSNYFLLSQVVQQISGDDLGSFLQREVFTPLALDAVMDPTATIAGKALSYSGSAGGWASADSPWQQLGDGAIQTTPTQLVKWATQYWAPTIGGEDINRTRFEGAVSVGGGQRYGFGIAEFDLDGQRVLTHSGGWGGFVTTFVVAPDQQLAVAGTCAAAESAPTTPMGDPGVDILRIWM
ncbi:MAG: serine hydrolase domain-containing protein [Ilumatobacteraceae bacterium]